MVTYISNILRLIILYICESDLRNHLIRPKLLRSIINAKKDIKTNKLNIRWRYSNDFKNWKTGYKKWQTSYKNYKLYKNKMTIRYNNK